ncbi:MAG: hypothetical protein J6V50_01355, partial [Clostridia bacterium]|nr:hypothetical protein [Clostridia bacterium]
NDQVGGIEGAITYDTNMFNYVGAVLNANFVAAGNPEEAVTVACTGDNGVVKFVGLNDNNSIGEWFVLQFEVVATGNATFAFENVKGANTEGYVTVAAVGDSTVVVDDSVVAVEGASIKKNADPAKQDIRFRVTFGEAPEGRTVVKYGMLLMFTKRLGYGELTYDMRVNGAEGLAWAEVAAADVTGGEFAVNLNNMKANQLGVKVSARAYAVLDNGDVIYSSNYNSEFNTKAGYDSKSVVDVARLAAKKIIDSNWCDDAAKVAAVEDILDLASIKDANRTTLLDFIATYYKFS